MYACTCMCVCVCVCVCVCEILTIEISFMKLNIIFKYIRTTKWKHQIGLCSMSNIRDTAVMQRK